MHFQGGAVSGEIEDIKLTFKTEMSKFVNYQMKGFFSDIIYLYKEN